LNNKGDSNKKATERKKQASTQEIKKRVNQIVRLIVAGFTSFSHVEDLNSKQGWDMSETQLWRYYGRAKKKIRENGFFFEDQKDVHIVSFGWLMDVLQNANKNKDDELKLKVIKEINKMFGTYAVNTFESSNDKKEEKKHTLSDEEIIKRLNIE